MTNLRMRSTSVGLGLVLIVSAGSAGYGTDAAALANAKPATKLAKESVKSESDQSSACLPVCGPRCDVLRLPMN